MLQQLPLLPCCQFDKQIGFLPSRAGVAPGCRTAHFSSLQAIIPASCELKEPILSAPGHSKRCSGWHCQRIQGENKVLFCSVKCLCQTLQRHPARRIKGKLILAIVLSYFENLLLAPCNRYICLF